MSAVKSAKKRVYESATSKSKKLKRVPIEDDFDLSNVAEFDEVQTKFEKKRHGLFKALLKSTKKCKNLLKNETANFQAIREQFREDKTAHLQALEDIISKYEEEKGRLVIRYKQQRKKEKSVISELEKACEPKIAELEESLKKEKQGGKALSILCSFLDNASGEDFPSDD